MTENEISRIVVDAAYCIHKHFGPGLQEIVYEVCLAHELRKRGLEVERQKVISVKYDSITFQEGFRADLVVDDKVVDEQAPRSVDQFQRGVDQRRDLAGGQRIARG